MPEEKVAGIDRRWWYVIGAGAGIVGYFVYKWWKNNQASSTGIVSMPTGAQTASTDLTGGGTTGSVANPIGSLSDWISQAQSWLVKSLNADPAVVQNALQHYANAHCLTTAEYNLVDKALGQLGMPPSAPYQGLIKCATPAPPKPVVKTPVLPTNELSKFTKVLNNTVLNNLLNQGYQVFNMGNVYYYLTGARVKSGRGHILQWVGGPTQQAELRAAGYTVYVYNNRAFYDPTQKVLARK